MKIKFIESKKINDNLNLDNMYLSASNPRYSLIDDIGINLKEFILSNDYKNEYENYINLLKTEGDFYDLFSLLNSILNNGFDNVSDPIYFVEDKDGSLVVAEGNRRLMCLKLIFSKFKFPEIWDEKIDFNNNFDYQNASSENSSTWDDELLDNPKKRIENYNICSKLINEIKEIYKNSTINVHVEISKDSDELWKLVYDKHLTGEPTGLRKWSRSKYFSDLLLIFKNGIKDINDNEYWKKIYKRIRRDRRMLLTDFKEAQYIYSCFYFSNPETSSYINVDFENINMDILNSIAKSSRISALERIHSYNKVVNIICNEILKIDKNEFSEKYMKIEFSKDNCRINFIYDQIKPNILLSFIFEKWKTKEITTREIKDEKIREKILDELSLILKNLNKINEIKTIDELEKINEFEFSKENLKEFIKTNEKKYHGENGWVLNRFRTALQIKEKNSIFIDLIKEKRKNIESVEPIDVFNNLELQLHHNFNSKTREVFLNAICCSLRSIFEQVIIWFTYSVIKSEQEDISKYIDEISNGSINKLYRNIRLTINRNNNINSKQGNFTSLIKIENGNVFINKILSMNLKEDIRQKEIQELSEWMHQIFSSNDENYLWNQINEFIHGSHRVYAREEYDKNLNNIDIFYGNIIKLIKNINFRNKNFEELNQKIIQSIRYEWDKKKNN